MKKLFKIYLKFGDLLFFIGMGMGFSMTLMAMHNPALAIIAAIILLAGVYPLLKKI